ncbi:hypothetical protein N431DRAFT_451589 [Stipitochalara longipes BDJ]|nr:hypothetical protein N431DRAFT_451589 [Stipitochalara longipes BDJ]
MSSPVKRYPTGLVRRPSQGSPGLVRRPTSRSGQAPLLPLSTPTIPLPLVRRRSQSIGQRPETPAQGEHPFITASSPIKSAMKRTTPTPTIPQTPVSDTSTERSTSKGEKKVIISGQTGEPKIGKGRKFKEELFFVFVLLPLSCWYTRGGKRLGIEDEEGSEMKVRRVPIGQREDVTVKIGGRAIS